MNWFAAIDDRPGVRLLDGLGMVLLGESAPRPRRRYIVVPIMVARRRKLAQLAVTIGAVGCASALFFSALGYRYGALSMEPRLAAASLQCIPLARAEPLPDGAEVKFRKVHLDRFVLPNMTKERIIK